jgi:carboxylesterase type B
MLNAANAVPGILSYSTVNLSYLPRPDGSTLTSSPDTLIAAGKFARVPFIVGDQEDEGTFFGLFTSNLTTPADVTTYLHTLFFPAAPRRTIAALVATYQDTLDDNGSPFRTGVLNNFYPQFKRVAAILGDLTFTLTRRVFLETATAVAPDVPAWSYLSSYAYGTPLVGTFHGSDLLQVFYGVLPNNAARSIRGYYFSFIHNLDPNEGSGLPEWPRWSTGRKLMGFGANRNEIVGDDFRADSYEFIQANAGVLRV